MEMLMSAFKTMVKNPVKESFLLKKTINILIIFFIFHKSNIKILLKWLLKHFSFIECSHKNHHTNLENSCDVWILAKYRRCKRFDDS